MASRAVAGLLALVLVLSSRAAAAAEDANATPSDVGPLLLSPTVVSGQALVQLRGPVFSTATGVDTTNSSSYAAFSVQGISATASWDAGFFSNVVRGLHAGVQFSLVSLRLVNAKLDLVQLFWPLMLTPPGTGALTVQWQNVSATTDCYTLFTYRTQAASWAAPNQAVAGPGYLYVASYSAGNVTVSGLNISCNLPVSTSYNGQPVLVADSSLALADAIACVQAQCTGDGGSSVWVTANIVVNGSHWPAKPQAMQIVRNVTVFSSVLDGNPIAIDWDANTAVMNIQPTDAYVTFENLWFMNLDALRGGRSPGSSAPLFSNPIWPIYVDRLRKAQIIVRNMTLTVPPKEYSWLTLWTVIITTPVPGISSMAWKLKATVGNISYSGGTNTSMVFDRLDSQGVAGYNLTWTSVVAPGSGFTKRVLDVEVPTFSFETYPNVSMVPCYTFDNLLGAMQDLQANPTPTHFTALVVWRNISLDPTRWPANGFYFTGPMGLVGADPSLNVLTVLDVAGVPKLLHTTQGPVIFYSVSIANLPNMTTTDSSLVQLNSVNTLPLTFITTNRTFSSTNCTTWGCAMSARVSLNSSTIFIPHREFLNLQTYLSQRSSSSPYAQYINMSKVTMGATSPTSMTFTTGTVFDSILRNVAVTYVLPGPLKSSYVDDVYPSPPPEDTSSSSDSLSAGAIAGIVVGCTVASIAIVGAIAWVVVYRLHRQLRSFQHSADQQEGEGQIGVQPSSSSVVHRPGSGMLDGTILAQSKSRAGATLDVNGNNSASSGAKVKAGGTDNDSDESPPAPIEELNTMLQSLQREIDDRHLVILDVLGQGGFGTVYKGMWKGLLVAVKTITFQDRMVGGGKAQQRAIMEAAISSSLAHPNVVITYSYDIKPLRVHNAGGEAGGFKISEAKVTDWKLYIIQEYCDAGSLRQAVLKARFYDDRKGEPRLDMVLDTALELANGLTHLHTKNIIHGDLNPNNVLLKRDNTRKYKAVCKIADFGLAMKMAPDQSHISNMRRGTPFYTSPEVLSVGNMTKAADVYSYGVMIWEMYHSCMCYKTHPQHGFLARENFPSFPPHCPTEVSALVSQCIAQDPTTRPTFPEICQALSKLLYKLQRGELPPGDAAAAGPVLQAPPPVSPS